jgi:hypothetical protein
MKLGYVLFFIGLVLVLINFTLPLPFDIITGLFGLGALGSSVALFTNAVKNNKKHS